MSLTRTEAGEDADPDHVGDHVATATAMTVDPRACSLPDRAASPASDAAISVPPGGIAPGHFDGGSGLPQQR
jgi:hypothetical protein